MSGSSGYRVCRGRPNAMIFSLAMTGGLQARLPKVDVETNRQAPKNARTHAYTHALWHEPRSFDPAEIRAGNAHLPILDVFQPSKSSHPSEPNSNQSTNLSGWMKYLSLIIYFNGRAAAIATFIVSVGLGVLLGFEILPRGERWIVFCHLVGLYLGKNSRC